MTQPRRAPRGRPPSGFVWSAATGDWRHAETGEAFCATRQRKIFEEKRRRRERSRYWDPSTGVRQRRLKRSGGRRAAKLQQSNLSNFASPCVRPLRK